MRLKALCLVLAALALLVSARAADQATPIDREKLRLPATDDGLPGAGPIRRGEWFQRVWFERRSEWAARGQQDAGAVVFLGDSITQGWQWTPSFFPGVKVANRGISGDMTRGVLVRLSEDVLALNPRAVVLLIGTNDLEEWNSPDIAASNVKLILERLREHNAAMPVVLCLTMPSSLQMRRPAHQIQKLNDLYQKLPANAPQVTVLDTYALFADAKGDAKPEEFPDLLHPNALGYAKFAAALRPILEHLGVAPAWPDEFVPEAGFESLFNGRDLSGWRYEGEDRLDGKTKTADGRFAISNGRFVVTVSRTLRDYKRIYTTRTFPKDFVLKLEFRASPNADSGIYIREPQIQCRDYLLAGPFANLKQYRPLDWNEIVVTVRGGLAHATCNGETIVDAQPVPPDGPIGLESDRGQVEYRRIRVAEAK